MLDWQRDGGRYNLSLHAPIDDEGGQPLIMQTSAGQVDEHGLRPERFVDRRPRRGTRAVTLQCDVGVVRFSASTQQHACVGGMQDYLSWWIQLPAIVAASPSLLQPGSVLNVAMTRTHGSVDVWTFEVMGLQDVRLSDDSAELTPAIKLMRRPGRTNRAYDTNAEVWLDAASPHWPLRVRLQEARGEAIVWTRAAASSVN